MTAYRAATTLNLDDAQETTQAVKEMFDELVQQNNIDIGQICCIIFSCTSDLRALNPATALRKVCDNLSFTPLFCVDEHETEGSLKMCIRMLVLSNQSIQKEQVRHIYLKGAKNLREDIKNG